MTREEAIMHFKEEAARLKQSVWPPYQDSIDALDMAIAALREQEELTRNLHDVARVQSGWISVEDRLPEEYVRVLVMVPEANKLIGSPDMDTDRVAEGRWVRWDRYVTHWMPMPEPPADSKEEPDETKTNDQTSDGRRHPAE